MSEVQSDMNKYHDLKVWNKGKELAEYVYVLAKDMQMMKSLVLQLKSKDTVSLFHLISPKVLAGILKKNSFTF